MEAIARGEAIGKCLEDLILISHEVQVAERDVKRTHLEREWAKEYCTVQLRGPRNSGHSQAVRALCDHYSVLIVCPNEHMKRIMVRECVDENRSATCVALHEVLSGHTRGVPLSDVDVLVVDGASLLKKRELREIYEMCYSRFAENAPFTIALVG